MENQKPKKLAIGGKVISIEKIGEKSLAQWKAQLKLAGVSVSDERAEMIYNLCGGRDANPEGKKEPVATLD